MAALRQRVYLEDYDKTGPATISHGETVAQHNDDEIGSHDTRHDDDAGGVTKKLLNYKPEDRERKGRLQCRKLVVIFILSILIYLNTLRGTFLHDDNPAILRNPDVKGDNPLHYLLQNDFWGTPMTSNGSHKSYRPLCVLTFRAERLLVGFSALYFHATNVILHACVSVLFAAMCNMIVFEASGGNSAYLCGALFSLHPIHTEAVAGIVGRAELLSGIFFLAAIICYEKCVQSVRVEAEKGNVNSITAFAAAMMLSAFAMLSKETGFTALGVMIAREGILLFCHAACPEAGPRVKRKLAWRTLIRMACAISWASMLFYLRFRIMGWTQPVFAGPDNPASKSPHFRVRFLTYSYLSWVNFKLLLYPVNLVYDWSYGTVPLIVSWGDPRNIATLVFMSLCIFTVTCIVIDALYCKCISPTLNGILLLIIPYLPASNLFFPVGFVVAERTLYLPSMGFVILLVTLWKWLCTTFTSRKMNFNFILLFLMLWYGGRTWRRNTDWDSKEALFRSGIEVAPNNAKVHYNYGNFLRDSQRYKEAAAEYEKTLGLYPGYAGALNNLATILEMDDATSRRAEELYVRLIRIQPGRTDAYKNLADLLMRKKRYDAAVDVYSRLLDSRGTNVVNIISLAELFLQHRMTKHAERLYVRVLTHYCNIQKDGEIMEIINDSTVQVDGKFTPQSCLSNEDDLPRVLRGYAELKSEQGLDESSAVLFKRVLRFDKRW